MGKQTLPRNVNSYITGMNSILQRFTCYLRANRDEKGYVEDIADLLDKPLMECKLYMAELHEMVWLIDSLHKLVYRSTLKNCMCISRKS